MQLFHNSKNHSFFLRDSNFGGSLLYVCYCYFAHRSPQEEEPVVPEDEITKEVVEDTVMEEVEVKDPESIMKDKTEEENQETEMKDKIEVEEPEAPMEETNEVEESETLVKETMADKEETKVEIKIQRNPEEMDSPKEAMIGTPAEAENEVPNTKVKTEEVPEPVTRVVITTTTTTTTTTRRTTRRTTTTTTPQPSQDPGILARIGNILNNGVGNLGGNIISGGSLLAAAASPLWAPLLVGKKRRKRDDPAANEIQDHKPINYLAKMILSHLKEARKTYN